MTVVFLFFLLYDIKIIIDFYTMPLYATLRKRTNLIRKRRHGFLSRSAHILRARRQKGRKVLSA